MIWVHDYHLIPLAAELRALGCKQRIGFFLHIPLPPPQILSAIPAHEWLMRALFAYDLVGLQSQADLQHLHRYLSSEAPAEIGRRRHACSPTAAACAPRRSRSASTSTSSSRSPKAPRRATCTQTHARAVCRAGSCWSASTGSTIRRACRIACAPSAHLLERYPENRGSATLIQVASPSREDVEAYNDIRRELEGLCGAINGDFGEIDWMPVRYIHRTVARKRLPGLFRAGRVGLVTPLRDGMNLVAKEFIASQDPADPGVLVLSRFAGAAEQLADALLVNPYDTQATAEAIQAACRCRSTSGRSGTSACSSRSGSTTSTGGASASSKPWWRADESVPTR